MAESRTYTIASLSTEFGVSLRTLRFYEQRGILEPRRAGTTRIYSSRDRIKIQLVLIGKRLGLSIDQIAKLIDAQPVVHQEQEPSADRLLSALSREQIEHQIAVLEEKLSSVQTAIGELRSRYDDPSFIPKPLLYSAG